MVSRALRRPHGGSRPVAHGASWQPALLALLALAVAAGMAPIAAAAPQRPAPRHDAVPRVALLVSQDTASAAAATAIGELPDVRIDRFDIGGSVTEMDHAARALRERRVDAAVSLGVDALAFYRRWGRRVPHAAALVPVGVGAEVTVSGEPSAADWKRLLDELGLQGDLVATAGSEEATLARLRELEDLRGERTRVVEVRDGAELARRAGEILAGAAAFVFVRDGALLDRRGGLALLKEAMRRRIPVLAFSPSLLRVGAVAALELPPVELARAAIRLALEVEGAAPEPRVVLAEGRARALGLRPSRALLDRAEAP